MKILILLALFSIQVFSNDVFESHEFQEEPDTEDILVNKSEKYLRNESMIYDLNTDLGIKDQRQYTGSDKNRLMASVHMAGKYEHLTDLYGLEISYLSKTPSYDNLWWGFQLFQYTTLFHNITQNATSGGEGSEADNIRPSNVENKISGIGPGVGYRFKLFLDFFNTEDTFETVDLFLNTLILDESHIGLRYSGYGLSTSYGLHKRTSTSYFYGGKFTYNIGSVTRDAIANESKNERTLALGWLSFAFNLGFFF